MSGTDFDPGRGDQNRERPTRWDDWTVDQWLEEAARFDKMALRFRHRPQLNASFRALAQDALVRAKDGRLSEVQVVPGTDWRHPQPRHGAARATNSDTEYFLPPRRTGAKGRTSFLRPSGSPRPFGNGGTISGRVTQCRNARRRRVWFRPEAMSRIELKVMTTRKAIPAANLAPTYVRALVVATGGAGQQGRLVCRIGRLLNRRSIRSATS